MIVTWTNQDVSTATRIEWADNRDFTNPSSILVNAEPPAELDLIPGVWYIRAYSQNGLEESEASNITVRTVQATRPNPPILADNTAYAVVKRTDGFVFVTVGTIPSDTVPLLSYIDGYNVVPRSAVTWSGSVQPAVVVAKCT